MQAMILGHPTVHPIGQVVERAGVLARGSRELRKPVVLVNVVAGASGRTEQPRRTVDLPPEMMAFLTDPLDLPSFRIETQSFNDDLNTWYAARIWTRIRAPAQTSSRTVNALISSR